VRRGHEEPSPADEFFPPDEPVEPVDYAAQFVPKPGTPANGAIELGGKIVAGFVLLCIGGIVCVCAAGALALVVKVVF
jgi:hypothetical protein